MAITASALLSLIKNKSSFIFATHMHELLNLQSMKTITTDKMKLCHLSISYDELTKSILYDRKLRNGSGASVYGLMVARSLDLPKDFLDQADEILLEITGTNKNIVEMVPSKYNNKVYVDSCVKCNRNKSQIELHTHHLIEQKHAGKNGIVDKIIKGDDGTDIDVGIIHKNAKDNLIILCRDCHVSLHSNKQELETISTGNGKIIRVRPNTPTTNGVPPLAIQQASA
jgi:DNA mismatch repair protein MutS